jgi:hypothetical protein
MPYDGQNRLGILPSIGIASAPIVYVLVLWVVTPWFTPGWRPFVPGLVMGVGSITTIVLINLVLRGHRKSRSEVIKSTKYI